MNEKNKVGFQHTLLATAMLCAFGGAQAGDEEVAALSKPDSSISVGVGNWSSERAQQGTYDGMRDNGAYGLVDIDIARRNDADGTWLNVVGRNLGLDPRDISIDYSRQGDIGIGFDYSRIVRENPLDFNSGLQGKSDEVQRLTNVTPGRGTDLNLKIKRDATGVRFFKNLMPGLDFNASFKNEEKNGERNWGVRTTTTNAASFMTEPIDSTTRQLDARLDYAKDKLQLSAGYYGSWYTNHNDLVTLTAFSNVGVANTTYLSLPLDNHAHQVYVEGGYQFTPTTRGTFKASYGRAEQDDTLPTRRIAGLSAAVSPYSLDGRIDTTRAQLGLTSRPIKDLSLVANLRYDDLDEKTPQAVITAGGVKVTPQDYRTLAGKLEGTYRLPYGYSVTAGVDHKDQKRSIPFGSLSNEGYDGQRAVPMRKRVEETTYRLEGRKSMSETINGTVSYSRSDRDGSSYNVIDNVSPPTAGNVASTNARNFVNPMHISDRVRDKWRLALDWSPAEKFSTQFAVDVANDDYSTKARRPYGLIDGSAVIYTIDADYKLTDEWSLTAWYSHDDTKAKYRLGSDLNLAAATTKTADLRERGDSVGLGVRGEVTSRFSIGADYQWSKTKSEYPQETGTGALAATVPLPDIKNRLTRLSLFGKYKLDKVSEVRFDYIFERWKTDDWTWQFSDGSPFVYGVNTDGTRVTFDDHQTSHFVGARYIYRFQ
ncbi:MtrB/PioB family decaheme-associated outer membrane protein [Azospira restricta]|uniref:MtrB/PioB family decaheme-associated outer membrane protein n=1 Tax=Azospira restricta TaxID=404405 RepID=A0A974SPV7_9RHOO|nr:MtrB/PioB family decaheme-associated outer membrane protein [Azospira restricta]QRJ64291.1 MtrB/PioB family decaheme-associated outer membrane protein [Azospira restricta]